MSTTISSRCQARFETLKCEIRELGLVRPGCVVRRFMPCGNQACRCMRRPPQLHGPYHQWTHKIVGKTQTVRLSAQQARLCRQWSSNHKRLKRLLHQMEQLSLKETDRILGAISKEVTPYGGSGQTQVRQQDGGGKRR